MRNKPTKINSMMFRVEKVINTFSGFGAEIRGRNEVTVRGCRRIEVYRDTLISLKIDTGYINICGRSLTCFSYSGTDMGISGKIRSVFFSDSPVKGGRA